MRAAAIQMTSGIDRAKNVESATQLIRKAAAQGAELAVTPEMTNILDRDTKRLFEHLPFEDPLPEVEHFTALAHELGIHVLLGSLAVPLAGETEGRKIANRSCLIGPKGAVATYDKAHLFDVDLPTGESWRESKVFEPGEHAVLANTPIGAIGLAICYDLRFPYLFRQLAQAGATVLTVPAAFTVPTGEAHWHTLLRARAIETGSFVIAPAQVGHHEDGRSTYGHSLIIDPWGKILAENKEPTPGVIIADLDLDKVKDVRTRLPAITLDRDVELRTYEL